MSGLAETAVARVKDWVRSHPKLAGTAAAVAAAYAIYRLTLRKRNYRGKIVLITGAGCGLGRLMALRFAQMGAKVVLWDINAKGLDAVAAEIGAALSKSGAAAAAAAAAGAGAADAKAAAADAAVGGASNAAGAQGVVWTYVCDVSNNATVQAVAERVRADVGDVDCLINNAGVVSGRYIEEISEGAIMRTFGVNTLALFWTIRAFLPGMIRKRAGHICNIASAAGLIGISKMTDYSASKFAAVGMTESLRNELKHRGLYGIRTTCVMPYYINTGMFAGIPSNPLLPILDEKYVVSRIVNAIRTEQEVLQLPALVNLLAPCRILPVSVFDWVGNVLKLNTTMDHFAGRTIDPPKPASASAAGAGAAK